jgi:hypothetical protein
VNVSVEEVIESSKSAQKSGLEDDEASHRIKNMSLRFVDLTKIDEDGRVRFFPAGVLETFLRSCAITLLDIPYIVTTADPSCKDVASCFAFHNSLADTPGICCMFSVYCLLLHRITSPACA